MNTKILKKFSFKNDQQGIINRYMRETENWDKHLQNTKEFIIQSTKQKKKNTCMILGSGWLLDVPIDELSQIFDKVILVDIVHPSQIVHKLRKHQNIEFITVDITGLMEVVYHFLKQKSKPPKSLDFIKLNYQNEWFHKLEHADFVASVNLLNQLDILICDYIKKTKTYTTEEILEFRKTIQQNHLDLLPKGKSCLITDYEEVRLNKGLIIETKPLVYIKLPTNDKSKKWPWNFDTHGTYHKNFDTVFKVIGIEL